MIKVMNKRAFKYFLVFLIPSLVLGVMTIRPMAANAFGQNITIRGSALNRRDVFRGDFMQLDYEINEVTLEHLDNEILKYKNENRNFEELKGKSLYITLKKEGSYYVVDKVMLKEPKEGIYLKGRYEYPIWVENKESMEGKINGIRIEYSIDKYFASSKDKNNRDFEKQIIYANLKVYKGYSLLKGIEY